MSNLSQFLAGGSSWIKSIQRGTITISGGATNNSATVTAVDTTKSRLLFLGFTTDFSSSGQVKPHLALEDSTTVRATRLGTTGVAIVSYELVEHF